MTRQRYKLIEDLLREQHPGAGILAVIERPRRGHDPEDAAHVVTHPISDDEGCHTMTAVFEKPLAGGAERIRFVLVYTRLSEHDALRLAVQQAGW